MGEGYKWVPIKFRDEFYLFPVQKKRTLSKAIENAHDRKPKGKLNEF